MKRFALAVLFMFFCPLLARGQVNPITGNITASGNCAANSNANCVIQILPANTSSVTVTTGNTFSATLAPEQSGDSGNTWTSAGSSITSPGVTTYTISSKNAFRVRASAYVSGTATVTIAYSTGGSSGGGAPSGPAGGELAGTYPNPTLLRSLIVGEGAPFMFSATGTFTNTQMFQYLYSTVNSCNPATIFHAAGASNFTTEAVTGCVEVPASNATNAFSIGVAGWAENDNTCTNCGAFGGRQGAIGIQGGAYAAVNNASAWGISAGATDKAGNTGNIIYGGEVDVETFSTSTSGAGLFLAMQGTAQPTGDNMPAYVVGPSSSSGSRWTSGFECQPNSIVASSLACLSVQPVSTGLSQSSQSIVLNAEDGSGAFSSTTQLHQSHVLLLGSVPVISQGAGNNATYGGGFGITLKSTSALTRNQLVKIDTANADSVVVCTTADTSCDGFVASDGTGNGLCTAGNTFCPLITTPGSLAKGILGTGTCAIGNYVIVDTTTNGRIQCTGTPPVLGAIIGKALSAQSSVGSTVDILTKFE